MAEHTLPDLAPLDRQLAHTAPPKRMPVFDRTPDENMDFASNLYSQEPAPQEDIPRDEAHNNYSNDGWNNEIFRNGVSSILYNVPLNDTKPELPTKPVVSKTLKQYDTLLLILALLLFAALVARYMLF